MKKTSHIAMRIAIAVSLSAVSVGRHPDGGIEAGFVTKASAGCKKLDIKCKAKEAKKAAEKKAKAAKEAAAKKAKAASKAVSKVGDIVEQVWKSMRTKILKPVGDLFKSAIDKAKKAMSALIDKAKKAMSGIIEGDVVIPALVWAIEHLLPGGAAGLAKVRVFVERLLGRAEAIAARQAEMAAVIQALQAGDASGYRSALAQFERGLEEWTNIGLKQIVTALIADLRVKLTEVVKGRTIDLLDKAFTLIERPIEAGKKAALGAIAAIPGVGGMLRGAADVVITQGISLLRSMGFEMVGLKAAQLATKALDNLEPVLLKGAAAFDTKLKPIMDTIKPHLDKALKVAHGVRAEWYKLRDKLRKAGKSLGKQSRLDGRLPGRALAAAAVPGGAR